ncbi:flagellar hook-length control protein FliK [Alkalihalobacillus sp. NPDC078783]
MNQFLPFQNVRGFVGLGSQPRSHHSSIGSESTAIAEFPSVESIRPSFSDVLQQFEGTSHKQERNESVVIKPIDTKEPEFELEEALQPFLGAEAHELAEYLDPELVTSIVLNVLSFPKEDQNQTSQAAITIEQKDAVTTPVSKMNPLDFVPNEADKIDRIPATYNQLVSEPKMSLVTNEKESKNGSSISGQEQSFSLNRTESVMPNLIPLSRVYQFQERQVTQPIDDPPVQIERLLSVIKESGDLPKRLLVTQDAELVQQVANKVETFFQANDRTTLNQLITEMKETVRPSVNKPVVMDVKGSTNELESSEELEKLLLHLKADKSTAKATEDTPKLVSVESKVESLLPNQTIAPPSLTGLVKKEVSEIDLKAAVRSEQKNVGSNPNERNVVPTRNEGKPAVLNENLIIPEKTVHASERVQQQPEALKAEGQADERRFVKTLQRILQQGSMIQRPDGQTSFTLKLFPEHLGKLQILVIQNGQKLAAQIIAESSATKDLVERSLPQLRQALHSQNLTFDQIDVEEFVNKDQQQQQEQEQSEQQEHQENEQESRTETSFSFKSLLEGLFS